MMAVYICQRDCLFDEWERNTRNIIIRLVIGEKRFYTRGTLTSKRIPRLAKNLTHNRDWLRSLK